MMRAALLPMLVLAACTSTPPSPEDIRRNCEAEARDDGIGGTVGVGIGSEGPVARGTIAVTNRAFDRRPPEERLAACLARRGAPSTTFGITLGDDL